MIKQVRVRYAPSPTGYPHMGNIRTALFNWLFARHSGGSLIIRIEDTDVSRKIEGTVEAILDALHWLGMDWDEGPDVGGNYGPYFQSQRLDIYHKAAEQLISQGNAYHCYCSTQRLDEMRAKQIKLKQPPGYDRHCRNLSREEKAKKEAGPITPVIRSKTPLEGQTRFNDLIRGKVAFKNATIDDFVLLKSDGYPTYHLASVIDDHLMEISHVLRAEEWLSSTPRHLMLYRALGFEPPQFAHLPILLGADRSKLSKRHGAMAITKYREQGYLAEAIVNSLALLGWSLDDKTEILSIKELKNSFSLERVNRTAAIFNKDKLEWINGIYIRGLSLEDFSKRSLLFLENGLPPEIKRPLSADYIRQVLPLIQERTKTLAEVAELTQFFFANELNYESDLLIAKKMNQALAVQALQTSFKRIEQLAVFDTESLEVILRPLAEELGLKTKQLFSTLRVAVTGRTVAPPLFLTMSVLGKECCLNRMREAITSLRKMRK